MGSDALLLWLTNPGRQDIEIGALVLRRLLVEAWEPFAASGSPVSERGVTTWLWRAEEP